MESTRPRGRVVAYTRCLPALVAQWIEHLTTDQKVGGSTPSERAELVQVRGTAGHAARLAARLDTPKRKRIANADLYSNSKCEPEGPVVTSCSSARCHSDTGCNQSFANARKLYGL